MKYIYNKIVVKKKGIKLSDFIKALTIVTPDNTIDFSKFIPTYVNDKQFNEWGKLNWGLDYKIEKIIFKNGNEIYFLSSSEKINSLLIAIFSLFDKYSDSNFKYTWYNEYTNETGIISYGDEKFMYRPFCNHVDSIAIKNTLKAQLKIK